MNNSWKEFVTLSSCCLLFLDSLEIGAEIKKLIVKKSLKSNKCSTAGMHRNFRQKLEKVISLSFPRLKFCGREVWLYVCRFYNKSKVLSVEGASLEISFLVACLECLSKTEQNQSFSTFVMKYNEDAWINNRYNFGTGVFYW